MSPGSKNQRLKPLRNSLIVRRAKFDGRDFWTVGRTVHGYFKVRRLLQSATEHFLLANHVMVFQKKLERQVYRNKLVSSARVRTTRRKRLVNKQENKRWKQKDT